MPRSEVQCPLAVKVAMSSLGVQGLTSVHGLVSKCQHLACAVALLLAICPWLHTYVRPIALRSPSGASQHYHRCCCPFACTRGPVMPYQIPQVWLYIHYLIWAVSIACTCSFPTLLDTLFGGRSFCLPFAQSLVHAPCQFTLEMSTLLLFYYGKWCAKKCWKTFNFRVTAVAVDGIRKK